MQTLRIAIIGSGPAGLMAATHISLVPAKVRLMRESSCAAS